MQFKHGAHCDRPGPVLPFCEVEIHAIKWAPAHGDRAGPGELDPYDTGTVAPRADRGGIGLAGRSGRCALCAADCLGSQRYQKSRALFLTVVPAGTWRQTPEALQTLSK
ncbi:hypothetical protein J6590_082947 [Homalodisca vitripennis]|nr:hypothetical protein J6590_082947 [Homalodisca vitripennis]